MSFSVLDFDLIFRIIKSREGKEKKGKACALSNCEEIWAY